MKKIVFKYSILCLLIFAGMTGCESDKEFLTEKPETFYTIDNAFSTSEQIDQELIAIYSQIRDLIANPSEESWIFALRLNGTDMFDVPSIRRSNTFNNYGIINPSHAHFNNIYSTFYQMIAKANLAIYAADLPQITWSSAQDKAYAVAQAKFFRAFAYRNLGELFGGVPVVQDVIRVPRYDFTRTTRLETYQYAIDELEQSYMDLPETTASGGRIVRGAALHYLCELYLAKGIQLETENNAGEARVAYARAIEYAGMLIDSPLYGLMTARFGTRKTEDPEYYYDGSAKQKPYSAVIGVTPGNVYWDLFQEGNVNYQDGNTECIWAIQVDFNAMKIEKDGKSKLPYSRTYGPVFRDGPKDYISGTLEDVGGRGISQVNTTWYTRDLIYEGQWADDLRNSEAVHRRKFLGNISGSAAYGKEIPWSDIYTTDANKSYCYPISCKISTDQYTGVDQGENMSNLFRDDYVIRLSETILLRAEARQRNGDKAGAAADINLLRDRAKCAYRVTAADMDDDFNMILDERARELVYEEWRWNTLFRMGGTIAVDRIRKYAFWPEAASSLSNISFNLWPIPQTVIDTNKEVVLPQNPGWENR